MYRIVRCLPIPTPTQYSPIVFDAAPEQVSSVNVLLSSFGLSDKAQGERNRQKKKSHNVSTLVKY